MESTEKCHGANDALISSDRSALLRNRLDGLRKDVDEFEEPGRRLKKSTRQTAKEITAIWNREVTLAERREEIFAILDTHEDSVTESTCRHAARGVLIEKAMNSMNETRTLLVTVDSGRVVDVYEKEAE